MEINCRKAANFNHNDSMFILTFYAIGILWYFMVLYESLFPKYGIYSTCSITAKVVTIVSIYS